MQVDLVSAFATSESMNSFEKKIIISSNDFITSKEQLLFKILDSYPHHKWRF
jgi:hypothetical protein